jgi:hypothetical protein
VDVGIVPATCYLSLRDEDDANSVGFRPHSHPSTPTAVKPSAARFNHCAFRRRVSGWVIWRYKSASGDVVGLGRARRSGTGTHRVMNVNVSDAQTGHC